MVSNRNTNSAPVRRNKDRHTAVALDSYLSMDSSAERQSGHEPEIAGTVDTDAANAQPASGDIRFASDFHDPLFPVKEVAYAGSKRAFDLAFASLFLLLFSPLFVILAIGVKVTSRGPILFKQVRVGRGGRRFYCYKFRSMVTQAEELKADLMHLNEATGPTFKIKHDPRVTAFGAFMRKFSLDELPQFVNVLTGDMSVVGPRPPIVSEVEQYSERDRLRLSVIPGLTCLWQISGRSNLTFEQWVNLDIQYIESMSLMQDIKIVLKTIPAVLKGSGAH